MKVGPVCAWNAPHPFEPRLQRVHRGHHGGLDVGPVCAWNALSISVTGLATCLRQQQKIKRL